MIQANELRIGNLVNYSDDNLNCVIKCILEFGLDVETSEEVFYTEYDRFSPIPLTEEWLLKFGFEKIKDKQVYFIAFNGRWHFLDLSEIEPRYKMGYENDGKIQIPIYFVHQLQNLYFALTGEELTLKTEL
jgi:hypothetical protein